MLINFQEIKTGSDFENFAQCFLQHLGYKIIRGASVGPDGGVDIICEQYNPYGQYGYRWLVSCKHLKRNVGQNDDEANINKLYEHKCQGFMFVYSSDVTESLRQSVEKISQNANCSHRFFCHREIENIVIASPKLYPLMNQFFPLSHDLIIGKIGTNPTCCDLRGLSAQDAIYAIYVRDTQTQKITVKVYGNCCADDYCEHLYRNKIEYGIYTLKEQEW
ncbi:MAG: hypothetical protein methR_P0406 [Methyloprofundus sp.]|nr:MAG: hypothetical protein methR_P0406 [Methyloprofundus sp.]